jgi:hypothetical protein
MAEIVGKNLYIEFGGTDLSSDFRTVTNNEETGLVDASAGSDAARTYIATLKDGTLDYSMVAQADGTATWDAVAPATAGTLIWGEEGTAAGNARHTVDALVASRSKDIPYDDLVIYNVSFQFNGAITDDVYP